ncbi:hypothetical protein PIB30_037233 [Stylosanthes scabra]|uniref:Uncharacterized protein n=1 Tax=Stylosanthes scabra TaxID=79078 RepID=A0ABU6RDW0_9FABA|nr:hypothetical protein [Stylosanthes scabra]
MISNNNEEKETCELRKGTWTPSEDAMLIEYVNKCGEGNWSSVRKNSQLMRCGKSCRLRWSNHLRPDLKKGAFSQEEEKLLVDLHAKFGNKWALIATKLPGRSDNDIKNFWNSKMKKQLKVRSPNKHPPKMVIQEAEREHFSSSSPPPPPSFHSVLASCYPKNNLTVEPPPPNISAHNLKQPNQNSSFSYTNNNANFMLPLTPMSPYYRASPPSSPHCQNSGLLNDVVMEGNSLRGKGKSKMDENETIAMAVEKEKDYEACETRKNPTSPQLIPTEKNNHGAPMPQLDDELIRLLKNYPLYSPVEKWYPAVGFETQVHDEGFTDDDQDWDIGNIWNIDGW